MRVFFDSSVLVAAYLEKHEFYAPARRYLRRADRGEIDMIICAHSLAEVFNTLTRPPYKAYLPDSFVRHSILGHIEQNTEIIPLEGADYLHAIDRLLNQDQRFRGIVYDALLAQAALNADTERLLTLNPDHFRRLGPDIRRLVHVPGD